MKGEAPCSSPTARPLAPHHTTPTSPSTLGLPPLCSLRRGREEAGGGRESARSGPPLPSASRYDPHRWAGESLPRAERGGASEGGVWRAAVKGDERHAHATDNPTRPAWGRRKANRSCGRNEEASLWAEEGGGHESGRRRTALWGRGVAAAAAWQAGGAPQRPSGSDGR